MIVLKWIYSVYAIILFVATMLLIFPFALVAGLFGHIRGGNIILGLCRLWGDIWFTLIFIWPRRIYESPHDKKRTYIFVTNHISYLDAALLPKVYRQKVRPLGKVEMSKVPLFGFIYKHAIVPVDRGSAENRMKSVRILRSILSKGISIIVFPEGTFNMTTEPLKEFYSGAFKIALETGTPIKPVLFLDNYRRLNYKSIFSFTPGRCRVLYLDEIKVEGLTIKDVDMLKKKVHDVMERKLREYDGGWRTPQAPLKGGIQILS